MVFVSCSSVASASIAAGPSKTRLAPTTIRICESRVQICKDQILRSLNPFEANIRQLNVYHKD
jgi:hypothetical protein